MVVGMSSAVPKLHNNYLQFKKRFECDLLLLNHTQRFRATTTNLLDVTLLLKPSGSTAALSSCRDFYKRFVFRIRRNCSEQILLLSRHINLSSPSDSEAMLYELMI